MKQLIKSFYKAIPFKKHIFTLVRNVLKPKESIYKHLSFKGIFKVDVGNGKSFQLNHYGFMIERNILEWIKKWLGKGIDRIMVEIMRTFRVRTGSRREHRSVFIDR